jgi:hypothetical protein
MWFIHMYSKQLNVSYLYVLTLVQVSCIIESEGETAQVLQPFEILRVLSVTNVSSSIPWLCSGRRLN